MIHITVSNVGKSNHIILHQESKFRLKRILLHFLVMDSRHQQTTGVITQYSTRKRLPFSFLFLPTLRSSSSVPKKMRNHTIIIVYIKYVVYRYAVYIWYIATHDDYSQIVNYFPKDRGGWKTIRLAFASFCTFSMLSLLDLGDVHDGVHPPWN